MHVAIIGAGAAGLSTALTLHSRNIQCTIYESKEAPFRGVGALMLAPNALRILDSLGLYTQLRSRGFNFSTVDFRDEADGVTDTWQMGHRNKYGYDALRITRPVFLDVLRTAIEEKGIEVKYSSRYSHVVSETAEGVTFQLVDGTQVSTDILVGADGVYSEVRRTFAPDVQPSYSGTMAVIATTKHRYTDAQHPTRPPQTCMYYGKGSSSAMLVMPQEHDGSESCLGTLRKFPEQSREDWVHLSYNKDKLYELFKTGTQNWPARIQNAMAHIDKFDIYVWPFQSLPDMEQWTSLPHRRIIAVGDAVHTIHPTGGQGACQAIEDAYTLAMVISTISRANLPPESFQKSIAGWQAARQERIRKAQLFTKQIDNNRLPPEERAKLPKDTYWEPGQHPDLAWLYGAGLANSNAKGVARVEVKKEATGRRGTVTRVRAATVDGTYGLPPQNLQGLQRIGTGDIVKGAC